MNMHRRPRLAVWKFASCDGCQLSLLDCEDELLAVAGAVEIANFPEATSAFIPGPYDLSLVEGSILTAHDAERIQEVRRQSRHLVTIGACATAGGIQALRNFRDAQECIAAVYASPQYIDTLATSTPISEHVPVDFELRGCPINKAQLVEVISAFLAGRKPGIPRTACAWSASGAARSVSWSRARPAWGRSRMRAAAPSARPMRAAAMAASGPWKPPTPPPWQGMGLARRQRAGHPARLPQLQRLGRTVPRGE